MKTRITELIGIRYPILQGGMAWVASHPLAIAVSKAGGLGVIAGGSAPADVIEKEIDALRQATDAPFGLNIMLLSPFAKDLVQLAIDKKVPVVTTGAGNPAPFIEDMKAAGIKVIPVVPSVALAVRMQRYGADAVVFEGTEAGGHIGELTTMAALPQVVDAVDIPVVAAGGIADARGLAAAFCLGAQGVQMGTRLLATEEVRLHPNYVDRVLKAKDRDAIVSGRSTGHPVRALKNRFQLHYIEREKQGASTEELEALGAGRLRAAVVDGDVENGSVMAGQVAGLVKEVLPVAQIFEDMVAGAETVLAAAQTKWDV
ncbi:MAG: enoyl-[acyl-carrier-protein] reductase FabK [Tissierellia bacterium]|nr:enoyl-[acyl-carrier-protein] reductase FabK [Bacillota bacterium]NLK58660.1 enoyl-[acyl-carrier-protein] reductase FabK [Tissierellia bacterium]